eukprot:m.1277662 g.1277662  ORF g.1277662 m.1277662 type:complete len:70 (+) comp24764_c0_seq34:4671-4880(+)
MEQNPSEFGVPDEEQPLAADTRTRDTHVDHMRSGSVWQLVLQGANAVSAWRTACGPADPAVARKFQGCV